MSLPFRSGGRIYPVLVLKQASRMTRDDGPGLYVPEMKTLLLQTWSFFFISQENFAYLYFQEKQLAVQALH
jgi:hypothetical protein